ncbi:hypothetical protein [Pseudotabrizicola formosa]|uniref:hypothetical protein n=1 Tax=Pseudotabrizicola formosa TaxID=2030009 RepID=UPI0011AF1B33|nr:hypothetical protein [Pseudotabrizicola formosa]
MAGRAYIAGIETQGKKAMMSAKVLKSGSMPLQGLFASIASGFKVFFAAALVANAFENRRKPAAEDLRVLGIDPARFDVRV